MLLVFIRLGFFRFLLFRRSYVAHFPSLWRSLLVTSLRPVSLTDQMRSPSFFRNPFPSADTASVSFSVITYTAPSRAVFHPGGGGEPQQTVCSLYQGGQSYARSVSLTARQENRPSSSRWSERFQSLTPQRRHLFCSSSLVACHSSIQPVSSQTKRPRCGTSDRCPACVCDSSCAGPGVDK